MDICHLKNAELEAKHQKYKGRVVLQGDIVKVDSGSYAVFTEQGSTASQMTAAKVMDIISRLPGCAGQAADAVSALYPGKIIPKSECPDIWIRLPQHEWPKSWSSMEDPVVPLQRNLYGHFSAGLLWKRQFEKVLFEILLGECFQLGMFIRTQWKSIILCLCMWMTSNWLERDNKEVLCGKYETEKLIWENQHLSLIMYPWDVLKDNVK